MTMWLCEIESSRDNRISWTTGWKPLPKSSIQARSPEIILRPGTGEMVTAKASLDTELVHFV